jgi:hypothetical protein
MRNIHVTRAESFIKKNYFATVVQTDAGSHTSESKGLILLLLIESKVLQRCLANRQTSPKRNQTNMFAKSYI